MDDERISLILGNSAYKAGLRLFLSGGIGGPEDLGDGLYKVRTGDGNLVIVGHEGGRLRYSCGCVGPHPCAHEAAAVISLYGPEPRDASEPREDDPDVVGFIEGCIDNIARFADEPDDERLYDPYDDGDDRGYEDPEVDPGTDLEGMLLEHAWRVCDDISDRIWDPDNTVSLVQALVEAVGDDPSLRRAVDGRIRSFAPAVRGASARALLACYQGEEPPWVDAHMQSVPEATLEELVSLLAGRPRRLYPGVLMAAGEYEDYVESRGGCEEALLEVAGILASTGRIKEARRFADRLPRPSEAPPGWRGIAGVYRAIGDCDTAAGYLLPPFLESPSDDAMMELMAFTDRHSREDLVSMVEDAAEDRPTSERLTFLAEHGRVGSASRILDGLTPDGLAEMHSGRLFGALMARGEGDGAVRTARALIVRTLEGRDSGRYDKAVDALMALDSAPPGMRVDGEDAEGFKAGLRRRFGRLNKFWSMYRDEGGVYRRRVRMMRRCTNRHKHHESAVS